MRIKEAKVQGLWSLSMFLVAAALSSCGGGIATKQVYPTSGELFVNGTPAVGAQIFFQPVQDNTPDKWPEGFPRATVGEGGKFKVGTYAAEDGCPEGEYIVTVTWPASVANEEEEEEESPDRLQGRYADPTTSQLRAKVDSKPTQLERYDLK